MGENIKINILNAQEKKYYLKRNRMIINIDKFNPFQLLFFILYT